MGVGLSNKKQSGNKNVPLLPPPHPQQRAERQHTASIQLHYELCFRPSKADAKIRLFLHLEENSCKVITI